jgi:hypothetical protein
MLPSPFLAAHLRHSAAVVVLARVLVTIAMAMSRNPIAGAHFLLLMPVLAVALTLADDRRTGARVLYANLGVGPWVLGAWTAGVAVAGELAVQASLARFTRA